MQGWPTLKWPRIGDFFGVYPIFRYTNIHYSSFFIAKNSRNFENAEINWNIFQS
jgi:hypothetical protein